MRLKKIALMGTAAALVAAVPAYAGCGVDAKLQPSSWQVGTTGHMQPIDYDHDDSIVGLWSVQFLVNGNQFDFGYQQWHRDHTEILNSGARAPATQNFCLGVWERAGSRYQLNHYALSYDPSSGNLNGRVNIRENVGLDPRGNSYSGTFSIQVIDPVKNTVLQSFSGRVTGKRITVDTGPVP